MYSKIATTLTLLLALVSGSAYASLRGTTRELGDRCYEEGTRCVADFECCDGLDCVKSGLLEKVCIPGGRARRDLQQCASAGQECGSVNHEIQRCCDGYQCGYDSTTGQVNVCVKDDTRE